MAHLAGAIVKVLVKFHPYTSVTADINFDGLVCGQVEMCIRDRLRTFTNVPIIFLTAKDEATDKLSGLGLGADDYISKPFMPQE